MYNFLDVFYNKEKQSLEFSDGTTRKIQEKEKNFFKYRKKLKALKENDNYKIIRWADIHRHSGYSLLDGCISLEDMVNHTEFAGAVTDHGNMFAALGYYKLMKKANKLPLIGEEFYCENITGEKERRHLILLAKNEIGYKNLMKLSSLAYDNIYYKPQISYQMLSDYSEGLICTSACLGGEISTLLKNGNLVKAEAVVRWFKKLFKDDFYLEIQRHNIADEKIVNPLLIKLSKKFNVKIVAATDAHYVNKDDKDTHEIVLCIGTKSLLSDSKRMNGFDGEGYHIHTADEMDELFKDIPEALDSTLEIMEKCKGLTIETGKHYLPNFPVPKSYESIEEYFKKVSRDGFKDRFNEKFAILDTDSPETKKEKEKQKKKYWERWKFEMSVISQMGFEGYFLIVWDFLKFCRDNDIPIGPGRGSGAGSLVLYCLRITDYDPIEFGLLFERFLNPDRISLPDIDSDISEEKRELVIDYVRDKYGKENVSQIITFGRLAAKAAIKDVGRVKGIPAKEVLKITKSIPDTPGIKIKDALKVSPEFKKYYNDNPAYKEIIDIAMKIEGLPRQTGVHACFDANTLVKTENGFIKIKDVKVGDKVLTHKNRWKPVVNTIITETNTEMTIYSSAAMPIKCTKNHPFLIRRALYKNGKKVGYTKPEWINAEHLSVGDYVLSIDNQSNNIFIPKIEGINTDCYEFWHLIGLYIGDGWTEYPKRAKLINKYKNDKRIIICSDKKGIKLNKITNDLNKLNIPYRISESETVLKVYIKSLKLFDFLQIFGKGASNKTLTNIIFNLPEKYIKSFIDGYRDSDGYVHEKGKIVFSTVSPNLATEVSCILNSYYSPITCTLRQGGESIICNRQVNIRDKYVLFLNQNKKRYNSSFRDENFLWHKIKKINVKSVENKPMYNLTIADDNSYTANNVVVHNCGILIGQKPITEYCPTAKVLDEITKTHTTTSQYVGPECEEVGLVKFDFLGLRTLDVEASAVKQINRTENTNLTVDDIPLYDPKVYKFLLKGHTDGVFQFESPGMTKLLKQMFSDVKVRTDTEEKGREYFERLIAAVSLYRPGPIDEIPNYIKAMKSGLIEYDHPKLESILSSTYGIFVYQEEIMFAVRELAGFSAGQSDTVRKAMGLFWPSYYGNIVA